MAVGSEQRGNIIFLAAMPRAPRRSEGRSDGRSDRRPEFRVNANNFFLTYSRCDLEPTEIIEFLRTLEGDRIQWIVAAQEQHEDGGYHLHVQMHYEKQRNIRRDDFFDTNVYHANVQGTKNMKRVGEYVTKGGNYALYGITEEEFRLAIEGKKLNKWEEIYKSETYEEACDAVKRIDPRSWGNNGDRIRQNLRYDYGRVYNNYVPNFQDVRDAYTPPEVQGWLDNEYTRETRARCLFLIGATKLGKTHWARSIVEPHVYWKNMVNLDTWNPDAQLIIFDDVDWKWMPNPKGYLTQAGECTVTDKYKKKKTINVHMPAIYLCNDMPLNDQGVPLCDDTYWKDNGMFIRVYDKMYID